MKSKAPNKAPNKAPKKAPNKATSKATSLAPNKATSKETSLEPNKATSLAPSKAPNEASNKESNISTIIVKIKAIIKAKSIVAIKETVAKVLHKKWYKCSINIKGKKVSIGLLSIAVLFLIILIISAIILFANLLEDNRLMVFSGEGFCITDNRVSDMMFADLDKVKPGNISKTRSFPTGSELYNKTDGFYINPSNKEKDYKINGDYPIYLNNGAYLYVYNNNFDMIYSDMTKEQSQVNTFIGSGTLFSADMKKQNTQNIILLQLPNKLYVNVQEIKIETQNKVKVIAANSILRLQDNELSYYNITNKKPELNSITIVQGLSMVAFDNKRYTYDIFYELLHQDNSTVKAQEAAINEYHLNDDIYQYFMGARYDYTGEKIFYRSKDTFLMQYNGEKFPLYSMPLYFQKEKKLLLPCDYVIVEPKSYTMRKQPAMSEVYADNMAVYTKIGEKLRTYTDMFLFDGHSSYVFFNETIISIGNKNITVSAFANVKVSDDGTVEIYDYLKDEYKGFDTQGYKNVYAEIKGGTKIDILKDVLYLPGEKEQLLFSEPSKLEDVR